MVETRAFRERPQDTVEVRKMSANLYIALVHWPVRDREGKTLATAVTNLDVHDLARSARTYGVRRYYVVTPIEAQRRLVERILQHWDTGAGRRRVPERSEALDRCEAIASISHVLEDIRHREGALPFVYATGAQSRGRAVVHFSDARERIANADGQPILILFGTGHGLADEAIEKCNALLAPVEPASDYNHLSVRAACAIILDRLLAKGA